MTLQNTFTFDVDLKKITYLNEPTVMQNDDITFVVVIKDDDLDFPLTDVTNVSLANKRLDGITIVTVGTITGTNEVTFNLGTTETEVAGRVDATVQLYDANGRVSTITFSYKVVSDPTGNGFTPSESEQTLIQLVLNDGPLRIQEAIDAADYITAQGDLVQILLDETRYVADYSSVVSYKKNNVVTFNGSSFIAKQDTVGNAPPILPETNNLYWGLTGRKGADGVGTLVRHQDVFIATEGQTVFNLTNSYDQFQSRIDAMVGGVPQYSPDNFIETSSTVATLTEGVASGTKVVFTYFSYSE